MKIEKVYIGGWFQRTLLHLTEIYDFLRIGESKLALDTEKLQDLRSKLDIKSVEYGVRGLEYIELTTNSDINCKIYEDGLIVLNDSNSTSISLITDIEGLAEYYETKLSPAISYLFSLGAPVPKELANIQTVYPYFICLKGAKPEEMEALLDKTDNQKYYRFSNDNYDILRGDKYYFINNKKKDMDQIERYIEEQIFFREFKGQLHRYLNLHRTIWEKIDEVKETVKVKGKHIIEFHTKLQAYQKTINLVDTRINQMATYLRTREKIAKADDELNEFLNIMEYRYETLGDTLTYIQQIWKMTTNYVNSAISLFKDLDNQVTQKSVGNLTVVTSMGVGATLLGLFAKTELPTITGAGVLYFAILAVVGYSANKIMKTISSNRKYEVSDIEYEKNI